VHARVLQGEGGGSRQRGGERCLLPVPRRIGRTGQGWRRSRGTTRRLDPRRRSHRGRRSAWNGDGLYRNAALQALRELMVRTKVGVLASGRGSDFQSLVDAGSRGQLDVELAVLVCNVPGAPVLERAKKASVPAVVVDHRRSGTNREAFEREVVRILRERQVELVVFAGFMRLVSSYFVDQ